VPVPGGPAAARWELRSRSCLPFVRDRSRANGSAQASPSRTRPTCSCSSAAPSSARRPADRRAHRGCVRGRRSRARRPPGRSHRLSQGGRGFHRSAVREQFSELDDEVGLDRDACEQHLVDAIAVSRPVEAAGRDRVARGCGARAVVGGVRSTVFRPGRVELAAPSEAALVSSCREGGSHGPFDPGHAVRGCAPLAVVSAIYRRWRLGVPPLAFPAHTATLDYLLAAIPGIT
jgi:hypothetical protein